ncbi:MAG: Rieske 2Fe-2S domain-containing protein [Candidatus Rokubacteria bacterium]|nr:Rieske 2Fe-2S domain-containing protein [Candidatus Rokubacteria bacterium]
MAEIPKLSGDIRPLIPPLGLRNDWYPAVRARKVGARKPMQLSLLGEELCLFRGITGDVAAIQDVCPHRGARLSEGDCHYRGTVACPYHGWVFDDAGKNVAVLSEGPDSGVCGKPGTEAKVYPTRTLKGVVFVWMGDGTRRRSRKTSPRSSSTAARSCSRARSRGAATGRSRSRTRWTRT